MLLLRREFPMAHGPYIPMVHGPWAVYSTLRRSPALATDINISAAWGGGSGVFVFMLWMCLICVDPEPSKSLNQRMQLRSIGRQIRAQNSHGEPIARKHVQKRKPLLTQLFFKKWSLIRHCGKRHPYLTHTQFSMNFSKTFEIVSKIAFLREYCYFFRARGYPPGC